MRVVEQLPFNQWGYTAADPASASGSRRKKWRGATLAGRGIKGRKTGWGLGGRQGAGVGIYRD